MLRNRTTDITDYFPLQKSLIFEQINSLWKQPCLLAPRHSRNAFPGQMSLTTRHEERRLFSQARNKKMLNSSKSVLIFEQFVDCATFFFGLILPGAVGRKWSVNVCIENPNPMKKMTIRSVVLYRLPQLNTFRNLWFLWLSTDKGK